MNDYPTQHLAVFGPQLAPPLLAEQAHELLGNQLNDALLPLHLFCEQQQERDDLSPWQMARVVETQRALDALAEYDAQFEELLAAYQQRLGTALGRLVGQVLPLEMALVQPGPDWQGIALRILARLYQHEPGVALACQRVVVQPRQPLNWEAIAFRLLDRLHRHEPPPPPSPFVQRVRALLDGARAARPLTERQALAAITSHSLAPLAQ